MPPMNKPEDYGKPQSHGRSPREKGGFWPRRRWAWAIGVAAVALGLLSVAQWGPAPAPRPAADAPIRAADSAPARPAGPAVTPGPPVPLQLEPRTVESSSSRAPVEQLAAKMDSRRDDWDTEVLSDAAIAQLAVLQTLLERSPTLDPLALRPLVHEKCQTQRLRPGDLQEVYRNGGLSVRRPKAKTTAELAGDGAEGLAPALDDLLQALGSPSDRHTKFKLYRITQQAEHFLTLVRYEASGRGPNGSRQQTAVWNCQWSYPDTEGMPPRLLRIELERYEEAEAELPDGRLFVDCTASVLGANADYRSHVVRGLNHWLTRLPREFLGQFGHHGLAVGDVNGDGLDDVYVCDAGGLPNRLYVQQADGTARDISAEAGVDFLDDSTGALLIDLDNDGDQDLVVGADPVLQIAENQGDGRFVLREGLEVNTDTFSLSAADYDRDGDLDLYVCGYNVRKRDPTDRGLPFPVPYHDANNGGRNVLLRNEGELRFVDATREAGLDENNSRFSMAASWEDFDNDGDLDLYVANDFGRNNLYRNEGGRFTDLAAAAGVEDHASGMSVSWADYNRDGRMDLYVGNMFSAAGNRVTYQRKFSQGQTEQTVVHLRRMARGNTLFANLSEGGIAEFRDVSEEQAVEMGRWAWASKFVDLTNDAWPDLIVANGYVTNHDPDDL